MLPNTSRLSLILTTLILTACGSSSSGSSSSLSSTSPASTLPPPTQTIPLTITSLSSTSLSGLPAGEALITDDVSWLNIWSQHSLNPLPNVDFATHAVVSASLGDLSGGGHAVEVVHVAQDLPTGQLIATIRKRLHASFKPNTKNITNPAHLVAVELQRPATGLLIRRQRDLDFEVLEAGSHSLIGANNPAAPSQLLALRDQPSLDAFWLQHDPSAQAPQLDFSKAFVVVALAGYKPSFGNAITTSRLIADETHSDIRLITQEQGYQGGAAPPQTTETPYEILRVDAAPGPLRQETFAALSLDTLDSGSGASYNGSPETLVIRDQRTLNNLYNTRLQRTAPTIDFSQDQVIATFRGPTTSNQTVNVANLRVSEDGELFTTIHTMSLFFGGTPTIAPSPFHIARAARTFGPQRLTTRDVTPRP